MRTVVDRKIAVSNIIKVVRTADTDDWSYGAAWYIKAHHKAVELATRYGLQVEQTAGIIAALSPRTEWNLNLRKAEEVCATGTTVGLSDAVRKAERILNGEPPLSVLGGDKVRSFFDNILDPLFSEAVTVDRHAFDIVAGETTDDDARRLLARVGVYDQIADAYREAARVLGLQPHQVQAVTWECWRKVKVYNLPQHASLYQGVRP